MGKILFVNYVATNCHDFNLFKLSRRNLSPAKRILADSGYQGLKKIFSQAETPFKATKKHPLTSEQKASNHQLSKLRIKVENVFARIKTFKIFSTRYRNHKRRLNLRFNLIAGICNLELKF